jgi:type I restriction enzyme M protein
MTSAQQRAELQRRIWQIANDVRGAVDGWDFKQYVLGALFYRFISENFANYIEAGDESISYAELSDNVITPEIKDDAIKTKGYFIYPSQLFVNIAKTANTNESLNTDLANIFNEIEASANGYPSEEDIKGLFADFDTTSNRLGNTVKDKNTRLAAVLKGVEELEFGNFDGSQIDLFGDAYEFLISNYAANAGKSGGEFFTPTSVSKLIAQLAMHNQKSVNKIYDPACGSGSLLLQAKKHFENHIVEEGFFGQEINHTTYNLARMNMFLHNINYDKFNIQLGNTLINPHFGSDKPFDAIVSNPPYSVKWIGDDDPTLINDDRFAPAGVLAPKSKADFAFVLHALSYLSGRGRAAIVCFPGIFYRGGAEQKIRKYLVDNNYVETVISLAPNLFFGTTIAVNILVLAKNKTNTLTQFIDASGLFKKETNNNVLTDEDDKDNPGHIQKIMQVFESKENIEHFAQSVPFEKIVENDYTLSVSSYVEAKDTREIIDITQLNAEIKTTVTKIDQLRKDIDAIISEIESAELERV